jgi:hypothetical protein
MKIVNEVNNRAIWSNVIKAVIEEILPYYRGRGISTSVREIYYRLVAKGLPNTGSAYKQLSGKIVEARMDGQIPWYMISDQSRYLYDNGVSKYRTPEEYIQANIDVLKNAHEGYKIPRWYGQPNYVEVWLEKKAAAGTIMSFLKDKEIRVVPLGGFDSWGNAYTHSERLNSITESGIKTEDIHIIYLGDFDPSGSDIEKLARQQLRSFGFGKVNFKRIAVTKEQIVQYGLPPQPEDSQTLLKLNQDPRTPEFIARHGQLYAVELEALTAYVPDEFEKLVQTEVESLFDNNIYQEILNKPEHVKTHIAELVNEKVEFKL